MVFIKATESKLANEMVNLKVTFDRRLRLKSQHCHQKGRGVPDLCTRTTGKVKRRGYQASPGYSGRPCFRTEEENNTTQAEGRCVREKAEGNEGQNLSNHSVPARVPAWSHSRKFTCLLIFPRSSNACSDSSAQCGLAYLGTKTRYFPYLIKVTTI